MMGYADLISVFGDVAKTIENFSETAIQSGILFRILLLKFSKNLHILLAKTIDDMDEENYKDDEEKKLFIKYHSFADKYLRIGVFFAMGATIYWHSKALPGFIISRIHHENTTLATPFRIRIFIDFTPLHRVLLLYVYEITMIYISNIGIVLLIVYTLIVGNICIQLAVLSHRIKIYFDDNNDKNISRKYISFSKHIEKHCQLILMVRQTNDVYYVQLFYELLSYTILLAALIYSGTLSYSQLDFLSTVFLGAYIVCILMVIFLTCYLGECMHTEVDNLRDTYYQCLSYNLSIKDKKKLMICMIIADRPLDLTAGGFYIYSLHSFLLIIKSSMAQEEFDDASKIMNLNKFLLSTLGLWPNKKNTFIFILTFGYFVYHMFCEYLDLLLFIDDLEHVIENLTENMAFTQILVRIAMLKKYNRKLGDIINEAIKDYDYKLYKTTEEKKVFIDYIKRAKLFCKLLCIFVAMTASSYYVKPITSPPPQPPPSSTINDDDFIINNLTKPFILPYRFYLFHQVNDFKMYVITYVSQFPFVFVSGFGQTAADCLMVSLVFHICGKLAVLSIKISTINPNINFCKKQLNEIIIEHNRLLKMGQDIEEAFSETLLIHLVGATSLVCILGYQLLTNYAKGQNADLATFLIFIFLVFLILYAHCVVGESLITESNKVCEAYYACQWYNMPHDTSNGIILCMIRSQKPLGLSAGKFKTLCLSTLTEVLKTAMGYLSVLRSFLAV
ncbi:uncharacterized protein LOC122847613 [Aphidius gifuensis]|uniref:uncharacterized protein LOC122847613 n=1 Tax=Aphidius gifuensis TaxID=684658 RepID=UPI001CDD6C7E|nr:uncharacterized protein LOC122847613 [Aphidius gifuensis]